MDSEGDRELRRYQKSSDLYERAKGSLAGGVSSHFRVFEQPHPLFFARAKGARIWDVDGNEYLDFTLSQGPMILGHSNPIVLDAIQKANSYGQLYAGQHLAELELAEAVQRVVPCAQLVRFCVSGSEAAQAALRVARVYTGRHKYLKFEGHYHGWLDSVAFSVNPSGNAISAGSGMEPVPWAAGIPPVLKDEVLVLPWNDLKKVQETLKEHSSEIAAIIAEPVMCNNGCILPEPGFLEGLREACTRYGVVLIFDEIITGFRVALGGAQAHFKVTPDLAILGKAMGSGFPISAIAGSRPIMDLIASGGALQAGTMNSQNACVAAALATVTELEQKSQSMYGHLYQLSETLQKELVAAAKEHGHQVLIQGLGPMFHMGFTPASKVRDYRDTFGYDTKKYLAFCRGMRERGIRLISRGLWYLSTVHTSKDIDECVAATREAFSELPRD
jgi:glutamate-1-semialdehyde 2,1-aminomutase